MSLNVHEGRRHAGDLILSADDVVVGSGAGGAVIAAHLAESGRRVVILEEGPYLSDATIRTLRPSEHLRRAWRDGGMSVAVGVGDSPSINVTMGRVIGGSSMVTGAVCFRTPESVLAKWSGDLGLSELTPSGLDSAFSEVEKAISVTEVPESMRSESTRRFAQGATALGYEMKPLRRNTQDCNGCGRCNFGCPHGAKMSVDKTYLPRAVAAGAELWSDVLVSELLLKGGRAVGVRGTIQGRGGLFSRTGRVTVHAKRVILAAGAFHTPKLLASAGVGGPAVGRNMTLHPSFRMFARFSDRIDGSVGALQSAYSKSLEHEGITMVSMFVPSGVLAATMTGFGAMHQARARQIPNLAVFGGLIHDEGGGRLFDGPLREPFATYRMDPHDRAKIPVLIRKMSEIYFAAGAVEVFPPILGQPGVDADAFRKLDLDHLPSTALECSSQHPLGSAKMGVSRDHSVVDPNGKTWDVDGLYVADGSIVPTSLGVNPQLTIMTLATTLARKLISA